MLVQPKGTAGVNGYQGTVPESFSSVLINLKNKFIYSNSMG